MKRLKEYLGKMKAAGLVAAFCIDGQEEMEVQGLTFDSKAAVPGGIFVCKGKNFRVEYLKEALQRGCLCYVSEKHYELSEGASWIQVRDIRKVMPVLAAVFYETEQQPVHLTGITGTKGKTTTAYYIKAILDVWERKQQKEETGILSSVDIYDGKEQEPAKMTTPEAIEIHRHIRNAADAGIRYLTMEVSSQALKYKRVRGLKFDVGVFLNISEDHISPCEHENFEDYFTSKLSLFKQTRVACVNLDSAEKERILSASRIAERVVTFGTTGAPDIWGHDIEMHDGKISFRVRCDRFHEKFHLRMHGLFNVENALAAIAAAYAYGVDVESMKEALASVQVKGRMEEFESKDRNLVAIVDYAHDFQRSWNCHSVCTPSHRRTEWKRNGREDRKEYCLSGIRREYDEGNVEPNRFKRTGQKCSSGLLLVGGCGGSDHRYPYRKLFRRQLRQRPGSGNYV